MLTASVPSPRRALRAACPQASRSCPRRRRTRRGMRADSRDPPGGYECSAPLSAPPLQMCECDAAASPLRRAVASVRARGGQAGSHGRGLLADRYSACSGRAPPPPDTRRQVVCGARPLSLSTAGRPAQQHRRGLGAPAPAQRTPRARCRAAPESAGSSPPSSMRRAAGESHLSCERGQSKVSSTPGQISR